MELEEKIKALENRLNELEAKEGIRDTISRYARAVDYSDFDDLESILTEDMVFDPGPWWPDQEGKENALKIWRDYCSTYQFPHRYITNQRIQVTGNVGTGSAYFFVTQSYKGESYIGWGTYEWSFRPENGVWKIARMAVDINTMTSLKEGWGMESDRVASFPPK